MRHFQHRAATFEKGHAYYGSAYFPNDDAEPFWGALRAIDPLTGALKWEWKHPSPTWSGVLSTAGGLVFTGDAEGNFMALEAASGQSIVALPVRRFGVFVTDVVCGGWETICRGRGRQRAVHVWPAVV